jgi:hypothetical protein
VRKGLQDQEKERMATWYLQSSHKPSHHKVAIQLNTFVVTEESPFRSTHGLKHQTLVEMSKQMTIIDPKILIEGGNRFLKGTQVSVSDTLAVVCNKISRIDLETLIIAGDGLIE